MSAAVAHARQIQAWVRVRGGISVRITVRVSARIILYHVVFLEPTRGVASVRAVVTVVDLWGQASSSGQALVRWVLSLRAKPLGSQTMLCSCIIRASWVQVRVRVGWSCCWFMDTLRHGHVLLQRGLWT